MKKIFILTVLFFAAILQTLSAQYLQFVENKGQWDTSVRYKTDFKGGALILRPSGYRVVLHDKEDMKQIAAWFSAHTDSTKNKKTANKLSKFILHSHAYEIDFLNANSNAAAEPDKPLGIYNNYFIGSDSSKWKTGCRVFNGVTYRNVYKNVDIRYYSDNGNLKYDIIVKPGADLSKIAMRFKGLSGMALNKFGNLEMKTTVGDVYQSIPLSYQVVNNLKTKVKVAFELEGNTVRFKPAKYDKTATLIIDPTEIFSTFVGSLSDNWGYTATYDNEGNFYAGGIAFDAGYDPRNVGGYDQTYNGGDNSEGAGPYDMAIIKFNPRGTLALFATYLGGSGDEQPHSLIVDRSGNLVISGRTTSANFPATAAAFGAGGSFDIVLAKLSADGRSLLAARKFGGTGSDGVNISPKYIIRDQSITTRRNYGDDARSEVIIDNANNIYLASCTRSSDFTTTANAFKKQLGGEQDGVFIKASPDLNNIYNCSLLGGNKDDAAFVLTINDVTGNIYVAGGTNSTDFAVRATNAPQGIVHNSYQGGQVDGFITAISADANTLLKTCYIGTDGNDMVYGIQTDKFGFPYITGTTSRAFPVYQSPFNANNNQVNGKQFITKLNTDLTRVIYSANFGRGANVPDISPTAFLVDVCGNAYVSGWGGTTNHGYNPGQSTSGLSVTPDALQPQSDGNDFYFFVLEKEASSQLYGSFFGTLDPAGAPDHVDGGTSRFDNRGVIYQGVCANCGKGGTFPTTTGSWSPGNPAQTGNMCNEAAVKIAFELSGIISSIRPSINGVYYDSSGCVPLTVDFTDTLALGKQYKWNFGDGSPQITTTVPTTSHTYNNVGNYRVMLISIDSASCNVSDTSYITIRVRDNIAQLGLQVAKLPPCESFNYQFTNTSVPAPVGFMDNAFTWDFGDGTVITSNARTLTHQYAASGTYNVRLYFSDTNYCNSPDSVIYQLRVASVLTAAFTTPPSGCTPYEAVFTNTSIGGQNFTWDFGDGSASTEVSPTHLYDNPGTYTVKLTATDNSTCNPADDTSIIVTVYEGPTASFIYSPTVPRENTPYQFTNTSIGATNYKWLFGDGDSLLTTSALPVTHIYTASGNYNVCLIAFNQQGCTDTVCQPVTAIITPVVDVPNAFSPNGDGVNDVIYVQGYAVSKMSWRIYNRWGQLLFTSSNVSTGWDGRYKGAMQPQEVYVYTLSIEFTDGTKTNRKGDITLLR